MATAARIIESRIVLVRGQRVMLDVDLAALYGVATKRLNEQVKRNAARFPKDFCFQLSALEKEKVVANCDHLVRIKFSPSQPYTFTEHGAIMAANVLNSGRAVEMSVLVVRAFVRLREMVASPGAREAPGRARDALDHQFKGVFDAIRRLMQPPEPKAKGRIGFV